MRTRNNGHGGGEGRDTGESVRSPKGRASAGRLRVPPTKISLAVAMKSKGVATEDARGLKPIEGEIVKEYIKNGGDKTGAVKSVGLKKNDIKVFEKPEVQKAILTAMEKVGITDEVLAQKIKEGLSATSVKIHEGAVVCEVPDYIARHKYIDTSLKVRGDLGAEMNVQNGNVQYNSFKDE